MQNGELLPLNATNWERAVANAMSASSETEAGIAAISGTKLVAPTPTMPPFLIWEYGLNELTPYVPNLYNLIDEGIAWQRIRGTPGAITKGLSWIGYTAALEEAETVRNYWNSFQLRFDALPTNDVPDLERIDGIASLSVPKRSQFRRGVFQYDVPALTADATRLDASMPDHESGVRLEADGPVWSFGRTHEIEHTLTEAEGTALANWVAPAGAGLTWADMTFPWSSATFAWNSDPAVAREIALAAWFDGKPIHIVLYDGASEVIGYRRARASHVVSIVGGGVYLFDGVNFSPATSGTRVYFEAMTQFSDASGVSAASVAVVVGGVPATGVKPGKLWLDPGELDGGTIVGNTALAIPLRTTVREQIKFMLRF